jgi:hypothetical protein
MDAGVNSPPAILSVHDDTQELTEAGPVTLVRGSMTAISVALIDTDVDDTLYVRMYLDYTIASPVPARVSCAATPNMTAYRTATCDVTSLCPSTGDFILTIVVFDRPLLDSGSPAYQAVPPDGLSTSKFFHLTCTS